MSSTVAIAAYPLSKAFRVLLEQRLGTTPEYLSVPQLRRLPIRSMIRELRSYNAQRCVLPLEDPASGPLLPILHVLASLAAPRSIHVVYPDFRIERVPTWRPAFSAGRIITASARNAHAARVSRRELTRLIDADLVMVAPQRSSSVLYLNANLWFGVKAGGSIGHMAGVANQLANRGHPVDLAAIAEPPLLGDGVRYSPLRMPKAFGMPYEFNKYGFQHQLVPQLLSLLARGGHAVIYERLSVSSYAGVLASRHRELPLVLEYNGSETWTSRHWGSALRDAGLATLAEDVCLRHAHLCVTVSDVLRDELLDRGVRPERIVTYPNCIDPSIFDPGRFSEPESEILRQQCGLAADATVVTFLGTFGQWHGVDVLARAIRRLVTEETAWLRRHRVRFLLVGDGLKGPDVDASLGSDGRASEFCVRTGLVAQAEAPRYLAASDILVSPHVPNPDGTPFFGSPTKLFEYMAMGKPIVASALDQIAQVLSPSLRVTGLPDGDPGNGGRELAVLSEPGSVEQLVQGVRFLVEHPAWRTRLGASAREEALSRYTWDKHVGSILERMGSLGLVRTG